MNRVVLQLAVTIDGYIARKDGSVDYLEGFDESLQKHFDDFLKGIDIIVMGRNTYEVMLDFGDVPFTDKSIYVLTSHSFESKYPHVSFVNQSVSEFLSDKKGTIWLFGGAKLIQSFLLLNAIDEYQLFIVPRILGEGIPLFLHSPEISNLKLVSTSKFGDNLELIYRRT